MVGVVNDSTLNANELFNDFFFFIAKGIPSISLHRTQIHLNTIFTKITLPFVFEDHIK